MQAVYNSGGDADRKRGKRWQGIFVPLNRLICTIDRVHLSPWRAYKITNFSPPDLASRQRACSRDFLAIDLIVLLRDSAQGINGNTGGHLFATV